MDLCVYCIENKEAESEDKKIMSKKNQQYLQGLMKDSKEIHGGLRHIAGTSFSFKELNFYIFR